MLILAISVIVISVWREVNVPSSNSTLVEIGEILNWPSFDSAIGVIIITFFGALSLFIWKQWFSLAQEIATKKFGEDVQEHLRFSKNLLIKLVVVGVISFIIAYFQLSFITTNANFGGEITSWAAHNTATQFLASIVLFIVNPTTGMLIFFMGITVKNIRFSYQELRQV